jgi:hypothetical protein
MVSPSGQAIIAPVVRVGQIIVAALVGGVLIFLVVALALGRAPANLAGAPPKLILTYYVAPVVVGTNLILAFVLPGQMVARVRRQLARDAESIKPDEDLQPLLAAYQTQMIVGAALCESAAFFASICYLVEGAMIAIPVALLALALVAFHFPTARRVEQWVDLQRELIEAERHGKS